MWSWPRRRCGSVTDYAHRLAMAELAVSDEAGIEVYEGDLAGSPHVMPTFLELMARHRPDEFVFVVGMDVLGNIDRWDDTQSIVNNATFAVARRAGTPVKLVDGLKARTFEFDDHADASSRLVREQLRRGEQPLPLSAAVQEYILTNGLYR
jgi:nicotinic acid mononucleotide adenylyltransferase